ncbi:MAG TPA: molybdenum cofactor guanylyltransferase [Opitutaceae bacterium]|nr:molybdenum cofactor guanylyltransferase [Opitutaceae bacterium]
MHITGLVLAGGHSRRMGTDKSALVLSDGRTLLARQVDLLRQAGVDEVIVSRRPGQPPIAVPAQTLIDCAPDSGPLAGIATALAAMRGELLFVIAVDMPHVSTAVVRQMISLASPGRGVVPHRGDSIECLVGVYPRELAAMAAERVAAGQLRVRDFAAIAEGMGAAMRWEIPERLVPEFRNWNTPEDVKAVG